jgi:hypothetical protein
MPILAQLLPPVVMVILGTLLLPESPSWLILHEQDEKAMAALYSFNGQDHKTAESVAILEAARQQERALQSESVLHPGCFKVKKKQERMFQGCRSTLHIDRMSCVYCRAVYWRQLRPSMFA